MANRRAALAGDVAFRHGGEYGRAALVLVRVSNLEILLFYILVASALRRKADIGTTYAIYRPKSRGLLLNHRYSA